jgi:serine/threonine protein kinase/formylglycine-generating enzyme required for sulfatase activity
MSQDSAPPQATAVLRLDGEETWAPQPPVAMPSGPVAYEILRERARGSMGLIQEARDPVLQRRVALKLLDPIAAIPNAEARFFDEARITAQLQHPSVVAVHALGTDDRGRPFFSMQLVEGRTLRDILDGLARRVPEDVRRFGRKRLVQMVMQICNSLAYAHSRGVIHRDLKPENIMLGEFGEVFVMDWGLAKIVRTDVPDPLVGGRPEGAVFQTRAGEITGTPSYMAPEQALGLVDALGPRSDIFSVGAILYEIMALRPPFTGSDARDVLRQAQRAPIRPLGEVAPEADIPAALEGVVMTCLARDPSDRYADATTLRDELEACLTGGRTVLHKVRDAARQVREATRVAQQFQELARQRRRLAREVQTALALRLPFDPPEEIEASWALADHLADLDREAAWTFEAAVALFHEVLAGEPLHPTAHEGLRDLLWYRFLEAERAGDTAAMAGYRSLALQHDPPRVGVLGERDPGSLRAAADGMGGLRVSGEGRFTLARYVLRARRLVPEPCAIGDSLPMGSYLIEATREGVNLRVPVEIGRQEVAEITVEFPSVALPPGLVFVPAGPCWQGSDARFVVSLPRVRVAQPAFAIARTPVTVAEYADYVNAAEVGARRGLLPSEAAWSAGQDGRLHPDQHGHNPITGLTVAQVRAYLAWRRDRDGVAWRLPSAAEWEKAARGADGRAFPWGDAWEPSFCRCAEGPEGGAPSPVGSETDQSPYGVQDLAGGVREWTSTEHPRDPRRRAVKGGSFLTGRAECHLAAVSFRKLDQGAPDLGFRLALDIG